MRITSRTTGAARVLLEPHPLINVVQEVIDGLLNALETEGGNLDDAYSQLKGLTNSFSSMPIGQVLQKLAGIFSDVVLSSVQAVGDALFDVLIDFANSAFSLLGTKLHIPVVSDILNAIGIPDITFLISSARFMRRQLGTLQTRQPQPASPPRLPQSDQITSGTLNPTHSTIFYHTHDIYETVKDLYMGGYAIAGFVGFIATFVNSFEAAVPSGEDSPCSIFSAAISVIDVASGAIASTAVLRGQDRFKASAPDSRLSYFIADDSRAVGAAANMLHVYQRPLSPWDIL
ncbi:hypothetical protein G7Z17_g6210 [Cylindrodendrum hubeiense]|uniref:Uncharacterized protein n=1 Tax=Cylindrodendrum hubeiense TaxID=595255 RepID=A0A9P5H9I8_9HYPO|nr:hypothetical protein G7Z17_g6210 [Cylindrodendrum hubeiense]